jgi:CRP-like cAMP-binding protein
MVAREVLAENRILAALPDAEQDRLGEAFELEDLDLKRVVLGPGAPIASVYFPVDAVVSTLTQLDEGPNVEIATIGNEGLVGLTVALGGSAMNPKEEAVVQVPGRALTIDAERFRDEIGRADGLSSAVNRYTQAFLSQVSQQVACNGLHSVEQRCARWLLLTHDRVRTDEFPMTQEFLAQMLGVRRASVSVTAGVLQRAGFVEFRRGRLRVTDREGLEGASCECYSVTREVFDRLLP